MNDAKIIDQHLNQSLVHPSVKKDGAQLLLFDYAQLKQANLLRKEAVWLKEKKMIQKNDETQVLSDDEYITYVICYECSCLRLSMFEIH